MNRSLHHAAFAVGLACIAWIATGYFPGNPLALTLVLLIGAFFLMGALELHRFQQAGTGLEKVLAATNEPPSDLALWLAALHPSLRNAVRLRVEGERVALPGPALAPYLAGLLVLLGMLGTFLGMVVTLKGTGLALENATDVEAIRASLAAPVRGLGLAFGTSVAGVAASAMLGLMSALARRERLHVAQQLDARIATTLHGFSRAHQREESLRLLRAQTETLPALVAQLQSLVAQTERQGLALQDRLLASQAQFHGEAQRAYTGLAESVDRSLKASLTESARLAGAAIEPAVQATMTGLARESASLREALAAAVQQQLDGATAHLATTTTALLDGVAARMERSAAQSAETWGQAHAAREAAAATREHERMTAFHDGLAAMTATLQRQSLQDGAAMAERQQQICATLEHTAQTVIAQAEAHARSTIAEIERLVQAAAQAPRAAAEVIGELRGALSESLVRDNAALDERNRLMNTLGGLLDAVNHASTEQRAAIDALVHTTTDLLDRAGTRFADTVAAESRSLHDVAAHVTGSAAEVASLGEGFGVAVQLFSRASEQLMAQLQRVEAALGHSMARSDEQLAYYVAQAREIIDLTLGSQKQIVDDLQQLAKSPAPAVARAEASAA
ncbi:MAG: hypothetical protein ABI781_07410 [Burkholderiales bacterium]